MNFNGGVCYITFVCIKYLYLTKIILESNMEQPSTRKFSISLSFEEIRLPPFEDILILGNKCPQGKVGVYRSFQLLVPDEFEVVEPKSDIIEAVFINKRLLKKIDIEKILSILSDKVFPFVSESEILKVDFKVRINYDPIETDSL